MKTSKYLVSREGHREEGLRALMCESGVGLSVVEEFGRKALTVDLTQEQAEKLKAHDSQISIEPYEGLRVPSHLEMMGVRPR